MTLFKFDESSVPIFYISYSLLPRDVHLKTKLLTFQLVVVARYNLTQICDQGVTKNIYEFLYKGRTIFADGINRVPKFT